MKNTSVTRTLIILTVTACLMIPAYLAAASYRIENLSSDVKYTADTWREFHHAGASDGRVVASFEKGATATFTFNGTGITWVGFRCTCTAGIANLYLDGEFIDTVDTYTPVDEPRQENIYTVSSLPAGHHTFTIEATGNFNGYSENSYIVIDTFEVTSADGAMTVFEETHTGITYSAASWLTIHDTRASGGSVAATHHAGATATIDFSGTGITWRGHRCSCAAGIANLYLDGSFIATVDTYAPESEPQAGDIYSLTGLAPGDHSFTIEVTGDYNREGDSAYVIVDAFDVETANGGGTDTTNPSARITEPGYWSVLSGTITTSAQATDDVGVTVVRFAVLHGEVIGDDTTAPYTMEWDTGAIPSGSLLSLQAWAQDAVGNVGVAGTDVIVMRDGEPSPVTLTAPASGTKVSGSVQVSAEAPELGELSWMAFYLDGVHWRVDDTPPYVVSWDTTTSAEGEHTLTAVAVGPQGRSRFIACERTVTVDNVQEPLSVLLTAPANDTLVSGDVSLSAQVDNADGPVTVEFIAASVTVAEDTEPPYATVWDSTTVPDGEYTLQVVATGAGGPASHQLSVTTDNGIPADTTPPVVTITSPRDGEEVAGSVEIAATATDAWGVSHVVFHVNDSLNVGGGFDDEPPFAITLNTSALTDGLYKLTAYAGDRAGNQAVSEVVDFHINNCIETGVACIEEDDAAISYADGWDLYAPAPGTSSSAIMHEGAAMVSNAFGDSLSFTFEGAGARWFGVRCSDWCGAVDISIDGGPPERVSTMSSQEFGRPGNLSRVLYSTPDLEYGVHTLKLTVVQVTPNPNLVNVYVDRFEVLSGNHQP